MTRSYIDNLADFLEESGSKDPKGNVMLCPSHYYKKISQNVIKYAKTRGIEIKEDTRKLCPEMSDAYTLRPGGVGMKEKIKPFPPSPIPKEFQALYNMYSKFLETGDPSHLPLMPDNCCPECGREYDPRPE